MIIMLLGFLLFFIGLYFIIKAILNNIKGYKEYRDFIDKNF